MNKITGTVKKLNDNIIVKNIVIAVCAIVIFIFTVTILLNVFTRHNKYIQVPDFKGMTLGQAEDASRKGKLRLEVNDSIYLPQMAGGVILDQLPLPGTDVKSGRRVFLTINSYRQRSVKIPYVAGFSLRQAKNNLEVAGLEIDRIVYREDMATNFVLEQQFNGTVITRTSDVEAEQGSGITLVVGWSSDQQWSPVPKVVGFPLHEAKSRLWELGFNIGKVEYDDDVTGFNKADARVWNQSPEQGGRQKPGTEVNLKLTLDPQKIQKGSAESDTAARRIVTEQIRAEEQNAEENEQ